MQHYVDFASNKKSIKKNDDKAGCGVSGLYVVTTKSPPFECPSVSHVTSENAPVKMEFH